MSTLPTFISKLVPRWWKIWTWCWTQYLRAQIPLSFLQRSRLVSHPYVRNVAYCWLQKRAGILTNRISKDLLLLVMKTIQLLGKSTIIWQWNYGQIRGYLVSGQLAVSGRKGQMRMRGQIGKGCSIRLRTWTRVRRCRHRRVIFRIRSIMSRRSILGIRFSTSWRRRKGLWESRRLRGWWRKSQKLN